MFRLANFDDEDNVEGSVYRYISNAISGTITDCLNEYLEGREKYDTFYNSFYAGGFFDGISRYIKPGNHATRAYSADDRVGYEFTLLKMHRMREKMQDQAELYTFDVFEERILFLMCKVKAGKSRTAEGRQLRDRLKGKVEATKTELRVKYGLSARDANDYSRRMYYASAMLLKDDEDDNIVFWDDDYAFFWKDGFIRGIDYLKGLEGQTAGYGYQYASDIFSDIGLRPPLMLLGTKEANRLATEVQEERHRKQMDEFFGNIMRAKSIDDVKGWGENGDELPFG